MSITQAVRVLLLESIQPTNLLVLFISSCCAISAQTTGTIHGQISDSSGAGVPSANVTVENLSTGLAWKAISNSLGSYLVPLLPPGSYRLTVEASGFKAFAQTGITVVVAENARVDVLLDVGSVTEKVDVSASALVVDTQSSTVGATVDNRRIEDMPLNGRNVLVLMQLLPGVGLSTFNPVVTNARGGPAVSVSGSRGNQNNITLDGTNMVEQFIGLATNLPNPDAIQEFRVLTNTYDAQNGRANGAVLQAVTKSGTNEFHGNLFEYLRNDALNARNFFAAGKPILRQNQFGGSIGGPVLLPGYNGRQRTFFFFSYQGMRIAEQRILTNFPPTQQERAGDFSASPNAIIDPITRSPFPGNRIPSSRFDPMAVSILNTYVPQLPNQPSGANLLLAKIPTNVNQYTLRGDHQFNSSNHLKFRWFHDATDQTNPIAGDIVGPGATSTNLTETEGLTYTRIFSPGLLNEALFSHLRTSPTINPFAGLKSPKDLGGLYNFDGPLAGPPAANVVGRFNLSPPILFAEPDTTFQFSDNLTWIHGRHSTKVGTMVGVIRHTTIAQFPLAGRFGFAGGITGNAFADYLIGRPRDFFEQSFLVDDSRSRNYHFYAQDDFKVSSKLTLNFGLRYELDLRWFQKYDHQATVWPGVQSRVFPTAPLGLLYPGDPGIPRGLVPNDKNNLAPRFGFAWDPTGKGRTSVRGAYGIFYEYMYAGQSSVPNQSPPFIVNITVTTPPSFSDPFDVAHSGKDPFPYTVSKTNPNFPAQRVTVFRINPNFRTPYLQGFNINIQHQFGETLVLEGAYVGKIGHKLSGFRDANQAVYVPGATLETIPDLRPVNPQRFASILEHTSDHNASYHSLQVNLQKRFSHGYTFQVAYTLSKSIDDTSVYASDSAANIQDSNNYLKGQRGLSEWDQRHILAANLIWEIPFMKRNPVLGGWQLSGITRYTAGLPFSPYSGCDCALTGSGAYTGAQQRADLIGNPYMDPNRAHRDLISAYFNKAAFALPQTGKFGTSGRNILIGPGFSQTDLSLQKKFRLPGEIGAFQFRADFFNLFNQVNYNNPVNTFLSPAFGRILSAKDARIVQLALRFDF